MYASAVKSVKERVAASTEGRLEPVGWLEMESVFI